MDDEKMQKYQHLSFKAWFVWHLGSHHLLHNTFFWRDRFALCIWWLWKWRNSRVFENVETVLFIKLIELHNYSGAVGATCQEF